MPKFLTAVTLPGDPSSALQAATKQYVDAVAQGLSIKDSVRLATTAPLPTNVYSSGTLTAVSTGTLTIDGSTVNLNDRIMVKDEVAAANNGLYTCTTAGAVGVLYVLTRTTDMNTAAQVPGAFSFVESGTVNSGAGFVVASAGPYTLGTTAINWSQFSSGGTISAGTGLSKTGSVISLAPDTTASDITNSAVGDSRGAGSSGLAAAADHRHGREGFAIAGSSAVGDVAAAGSAATVSRSDHVHGREAFGNVVAETGWNSVSANGTSTSEARADHKHGSQGLGIPYVASLRAMGF